MCQTAKVRTPKTNGNRKKEEYTMICEKKQYIARLFAAHENVSSDPRGFLGVRAVGGVFLLLLLSFSPPEDLLSFPLER